MSTPFTPGPWFVDEHGVSSKAVLGIARVYHAATREGWSGSDLATMEHCKANACLMAAAPKLLAALEDLLEAVQSMQGTYTKKCGDTPEDMDICMHDEWAESFLEERAEEAAEVLAQVKAGSAS